MNEGYKKKNNLAPIKIYRDTYEKVKQKSLALSMVEGRRVSIPETLKRTFNIPNIDPILISDADMKRRLKK
jgi:hypothetical protein